MDLLQNPYIYFPPVEYCPDICRKKAELKHDSGPLIGNDLSKPHSSKKTRSRGGCLSCKKLKIKCNEGKPICEYCESRGNTCIYPAKKEKVRKKRISRANEAIARLQEGLKDDVIEEFTTIKPQQVSPCVKSLTNKAILMLNSMTIHLNISAFELRLLKVYLEYGAIFFTFETDPVAHKFWANEVPKLWRYSPLIKSALYAMSSTLLLANYEYEEIKDALIEDEVQSLFSSPVSALMTYDPSRINLYERSKKYTQEAIDLVGEYSKGLAQSPQSCEASEITGQLFISKAMLVGVKGVCPKLNNVKSLDDIDKCGIIELATIARNSFDIISKHIEKLIGTKYECITVPKERKVVEGDFNFPFIESLRSYVSNNSNSADFLQITFHEIISRMEKGSHRALIFKYPVPLFRSFIDFAADDFMTSVQARNHTAMKIMFCFASLCSLLDFALFRGRGVWEEYIELYKMHSFELFNGEFEDELDQNLYDCVLAGIKGQIPCNVDILRNIGRPAKNFIDGTIKVIPNPACDLLESPY